MRDGKRAALVIAAIAVLGCASTLIVRLGGGPPAGAPAAGPGQRGSGGGLVIGFLARDSSAARAGMRGPQLSASPGGGVAATARPVAVAAGKPVGTPRPAAGAERSVAAAPSFRILLEPLPVAADSVTAGFVGTDTGAPRALSLWRVDAGRAEKIGSTVSDGDARIQAPQLALPEAGLTLVVTPIGVLPGEPGASAPLRLARAPDSTFASPDPTPAGSPRWRPAAEAPSLQGGL